MTTGIWVDPAPSYMKHVRRRIDIVSMLRGMCNDKNDEVVDSIVAIEIPLTLDHFMLGYEG